MKATVFARGAFFLFISSVLIAIDSRGDFFQPIRTTLSVVNRSIEASIAFPSRVGTWWSYISLNVDNENTIDQLQQENKLLLARLKWAKMRLDQYVKTNQLVNAFSKQENSVLPAQVQREIFNYRQQIVINRGDESAVELGDAAVIIDGVVGQVTEVGRERSVLTLLSDAKMLTPVYIERNKLHTIAQGSGTKDLLLLSFLEMTADLRVGDVLLSSGRGGIYPKNYVVGRVMEVIKDSGSPYLKALVKMEAHSSYIDNVLLIKPTIATNSVFNQL